MDAIKEAMIREEDTGIRDPRLDDYRRVDLNFVTDGTLDRILAQRNHREEILRECFANDLKLALNYAEAALDHERDMRRAKFSTADELKETRTMLEAFLVAVMAAQREQGGE